MLASRGIILASVDENVLNAALSAGVNLFDDRPGLKKENDARGWLLLEHLAQWRDWNADPGHPFRGRVDMERVGLIGRERVDRFVPAFEPQYELNPREAKSSYGLTPPDLLTEMRYQMQQAMEEAKSVIDQVDKEYFNLFGRQYHLVEPYQCEGAELVLITSGTVTSTAREVIARSVSGRRKSRWSA